MAGRGHPAVICLTYRLHDLVSVFRLVEHRDKNVVAQVAGCEILRDLGRPAGDLTRHNGVSNALNRIANV